jgi:ribonuclease BN (tRNA processing enzyme)
MKLHMVNAEEGDCLILEWSDAQNAKRFVLIDGGPSGTYAAALAPTLESLKVAALDLVVNSHVDTDHTNGLLELFSAQLFGKEDERLSIGELWHNQFGATLDADGSIRKRFAALSTDAAVSTAFASACSEQLAGIAEGHNLLLRADALGVGINKSNDCKPFVVDKRWEYHLGSGKGPKVTVVGPTKANLDALRADWNAWIEAGARGLAGNSDQSVPNLSSIQFLVSEGDRTILFTGDGRSDHLLDALAAHELLDAHGGIDVDVLKVAHHGSNRNATRQFFSKVRAKVYAISANGKHDNPDLDLLEWIVDAAEEQKRSIKIVVTNAPPAVRALRKSRPPTKYTYELLVRDQSPYCTIEPSGAIHSVR